MDKKWILVDLSDDQQPCASFSARKVLGIYNSEEEAWQVSSDCWDCSGRQQFRVLPVEV